MKGKTEPDRIILEVAVEVVDAVDIEHSQRGRHLGHRRVRTKRL